MRRVLTIVELIMNTGKKQKLSVVETRTRGVLHYKIRKSVQGFRVKHIQYSFSMKWNRLESDMGSAVLEKVLRVLSDEKCRSPNPLPTHLAFYVP